MKNDFYVYALFRETGQPFYIGKGRGKRWRMHEQEADSRVHNPHKSAIIRNMLAGGWTEIPKVKLAQNLSNEQARAYEIAWIAALGRRPRGLLANKTDGGEGTVGYRFTSEQRAKLSAIFTGRKASPETRAKMRAAAIRNIVRNPERLAKMQAASKTPEARAKTSAACRGLKRSAKTCAAIAAFHRGRKRSPETRAKMKAFQSNRTSEHRARIADARRGKKASVETRAKLSAMRQGHPVSPETRAKLAAAARNRSPEYRAKIAAANRRRTHSAETRAKIGAASRERAAKFRSVENL